MRSSIFVLIGAIIILSIIGTQGLGGIYGARGQQVRALVWVLVNFIPLLVVLNLLEKSGRRPGNHRFKFNTKLIHQIIILIYVLVLLGVVLSQPFFEAHPIETLEGAYLMTIPMQLIIVLFLVFSSMEREEAAAPEKEKEAVPRIKEVPKIATVRIPDELKKECQVLISRGKLEQALELLREKLYCESGSEIYQAILLLQSEFTKLHTDELLGLITPDAGRVERAKISKAVIGLLNKAIN